MAAAEAARGGAATETRRNILAFAGWGTIALITLQATVAFIVFFWPRKLGAFGGTISAGSPSDYEVGDVEYFVEGKFYLVRLQEGFMALYQKCVHLGCTVPWRPEFEWPHEGQVVRGLFRCPCHGSTYLPNGQIIYGPAPRPLDYMTISLQDETLIVNTGNIKKREQWDPSQAYKV
ncbi:MAG: ubiquinol-cytochrome c reductase iron-sulfur subunit [Chloroflexota bacterium]